MSELKSKIEKIVKRNVSGQCIIGFSSLENLVPKKFKRLKYGITIGIKLDDSIIDNIKGGPTAEYAEHYDKINKTLNKTASDIKRMLKDQGNNAEVIKSTISVSEEKRIPNYINTLSVEFPHKTAATRSGLGWIGKTALFVSWEFGPRVRLVTILTDRKLETGIPVTDSLCGKCEICVNRCPAQASNGKNWHVQMKREDFFDAKKCRDTARKLGIQRIGRYDSLCGICVAVCPIGRREY